MENPYYVKPVDVSQFGKIREEKRQQNVLESQRERKLGMEEQRLENALATGESNRKTASLQQTAQRLKNDAGFMELAMKAISKLDPDDPELDKKVAETATLMEGIMVKQYAVPPEHAQALVTANLRNGTFTPENIRSLQQEDGLLQTGKTIGAIDPESYTSESVAEFNKSGDYGVLKRIPGKEKEISFEQKEAIKLKNKKEYKKWEKDQGFSEESNVLNLNQQRNLDAKLLNEEEKIINNPEEEAVQPAVEFFNKWSDKPYVYLWTTEEGRFFGSSEKVKKIELPVINGKQATAKEVYYTAKQTNKTVDEVLIDMGIDISGEKSTD